MVIFGHRTICQSLITAVLMHATVQCGICTHMYIYMASLSEQYNYVYTLSLSLSFCFSLSLNFQELFSLLPPSTKKSILMQASGECSAYGDDSYNTTPSPPLPLLSLSLSLSLSAEGAPTVLIKCRVWLVTVRLFPETMQTFGVCHSQPIAIV